MSDGQYWVEPDKVDGVVGDMTAHALDTYKYAGDLLKAQTPSFSNAGAEVADAFAHVRQRLADALQDTAQKMQQTNMDVAQGIRDYRRFDSQTAHDFKNIGGTAA